MNIPRIVIAGTHSGAGKTSVTLALMAAFRKAGVKVAPFKVGPDYIDPSYHSFAAGAPSHNLDSFLLSKDSVKNLFIQKAQGCELSIIEGVMGLYDGLTSKEETASTQEISKLLQAPILLVVDAKGMSRSSAAMVLGYLKFDPNIKIAGVILNRISSLRHYELLKESIEHYTGIPVVGGVPKNEKVKIPQRHLGLVTAQENPELLQCLDLLSELTVPDVAKEQPGIDLEKIKRISRDVGGIVGEGSRDGSRDRPLWGLSLRSSPRSTTIGIARDRAFSFYYQANCDLLESLGAELVPFSPLKDSELPENCSALYFGGGFPEMHAAELIENKPLMNSIAREIHSGMPVYAECGGLMYLSKSIETLEGEIFPMVGAVPGKIIMTKKLQSFGYKEGKSVRDSLLAKTGDFVRGHEFHYSRRIQDNLEDFSAYELKGKRNSNLQLEGYCKDSILASYLHLHFYSNPIWASRLVECAIKYAQKKEVLI